MLVWYEYYLKLLLRLLLLIICAEVEGYKVRSKDYSLDNEAIREGYRLSVVLMAED